ncbi:MAG TPA: hemerythrin domain-containing protein, partial [Caulobacteraceae bacterium]
MAQTHTGRSKGADKTKARRAHGGDQDAIKLLKADHREVEGWFSDYEKASGEGEKSRLAEKICLALKVHTRIEEEIFYPAARDELSDEDLLDEAIVEHAAAKDLIAEIETMEVSDDLFDAKIKVLGEQIEHHVGEEEDKMFPKLRKTGMDMAALGARMADRKEELMRQLRRPN